MFEYRAHKNVEYSDIHFSTHGAIDMLMKKFIYCFEAQDAAVVRQNADAVST